MQTIKIILIAYVIIVCIYTLLLNIGPANIRARLKGFRTRLEVVTAIVALLYVIAYLVTQFQK